MDDVRTRLSEALQAAEDLALLASPGPWKLNPDDDGEVFAADDVLAANAFALSNNQLRNTAAHIARWDPSTVLRLVKRDRQLLAAEAKAKADFDAKVLGWSGGSKQASEVIAATARLAALSEELVTAAAFWLGTQEADR